MINPRLRIYATALILGTLMLDIVVAEINWMVPETVRPSDANFVKDPADNGAALVRVAEIKGKPCELIFIGASNVEYWAKDGQRIWDKYYAPYDALNFGVAGDRTEDVLWRLDHTDLSDIHPKAAVIFIGLNNFADTPRDVAKGVEAVVKRVQAKFKGVKVLVVSITPNLRESRTVLAVNQILKTFDDHKTVFYIDLYSRMPRQGDNWKGLRSDELHFTEEGYQMWADEMEPIIRPILGEPPVSGTGMEAVGVSPVAH